MGCKTWGGVQGPNRIPARTKYVSLPKLAAALSAVRGRLSNIGAAAHGTSQKSILGPAIRKPFRDLKASLAGSDADAAAIKKAQ